MDLSKIKNALMEVEMELAGLYEKCLIGEFRDIASPHEGYALLEEELDELWDEVKKKRHLRDKLQMRNEARQIAAVAIRFMSDLT